MDDEQAMLPNAAKAEAAPGQAEPAQAQAQAQAEQAPVQAAPIPSQAESAPVQAAPAYAQAQVMPAQIQPPVVVQVQSTLEPQRRPERGKGMGIAAMILGILALPPAFIPFVNVLSFPLAILGVILGIVSLAKTNDFDTIKQLHPIGAL